MPSAAQWEYAAGGGKKSMSYTYSGSNDVDEVAWYWRNSGDKYLTGDWHWLRVKNNNSSSKIVGLKKPNELGLYDMSGNVREWCWDWYESRGADFSGRVWKGGGWIGGALACELTYRSGFRASGRGPDQGLRVCRSKKSETK